MRTAQHAPSHPWHYRPSAMALLFSCRFCRTQYTIRTMVHTRNTAPPSCPAMRTSGVDALANGASSSSVCVVFTASPRCCAPGPKPAASTGAGTAWEPAGNSACAAAKPSEGAFTAAELPDRTALNSAGCDLLRRGCVVACSLSAVPACPPAAGCTANRSTASKQTE